MIVSQRAMVNQTFITDSNKTVIIEPQRELCLILKRKQRWGLSLPLINRERNYRLKNEILLLKKKSKLELQNEKKRRKRREA